MAVFVLAIHGFFVIIFPSMYVKFSFPTSRLCWLCFCGAVFLWGSVAWKAASWCSGKEDGSIMIKPCLLEQIAIIATKRGFSTHFVVMGNAVHVLN